MSISTKARAAHIESNLYHHGFIKIIMTKVLRKKNKTREELLLDNYFLEDEKDPSSSKPKVEDPIEKPKNKPRTHGPLTEEEVVVTGEIVGKKSKLKCPSTPAKCFTRSQAVKLTTEKNVEEEVSPIKTDKKSKRS